MVALRYVSYIYLVEKSDLKASKLFKVDVRQVKGPLPGDSLQELFEVPPMGQREQTGVVLHLYARFLRGLFPHRHNQTV